jgi:hypothetical protein
LRFLALLPGGNILSETELGKVAASAYAAARGVSLQDFIRGQRGQYPQVTTEMVANAVIELASQAQGGEGESFLVSGAGVKPLS